MKNKAAMITAYERDVLPARELAAFRRVIEIP